MRYEVEVQRTFSVIVDIDAESPTHALEAANSSATPLPPYHEWEPLDGWTFVVRDAEGNILAEEG